MLPWVISIDFESKRKHKSYNSNGEIVSIDKKDYITLAHELAHVALDLWSLELSDELLQTDSLDPEYDNLNEQFIIEGLMDEDIPCENMIRFEFGEPVRYGHHAFED